MYSRRQILEGLSSNRDLDRKSNIGILTLSNDAPTPLDNQKYLQLTEGVQMIPTMENLPGAAILVRNNCQERGHERLPSTGTSLFRDRERWILQRDSVGVPLQSGLPQWAPASSSPTGKGSAKNR